MKIQIASDLHLEMCSHHEPELHDFYPVEDRDVLVLAGDIGAHRNGRANFGSFGLRTVDAR